MSERTCLLPEGGSFYKANLHCHSNWSDGALSIEELKEQYKSHGYSILAITDHEGFFYHPELDDEDFLTIAGYELSFNEDPGEGYERIITTHLCCYKKDPSDMYQPGYNTDYQNPYCGWANDDKKRSLIVGKGEPFGFSHEPDHVAYVIKTMQDEGFIVTYNHPKWSLESYRDYSRYLTVNNLEIYNHGSFLEGFDEHDAAVYDDMLRLRKGPLYCVAADDNHGMKDMFGGFTMFKAPSLTYENIIRAFENGEFYASEGPEIAELWVEDTADGNKTIHVRSKTPLKYVRLATGVRYADLIRASDPEHPIFEADFTIMKKHLYARLELADFSGRRAYTNAYIMQ